LRFFIVIRFKSSGKETKYKTKHESI